MTNDSDSFIREVDESLREDRMLTLAKQWAPYFIGGLIAVMAGILGWQQYDRMQTQGSRERAEAFAAAQEQARGGDFAASAAAFETLAEDGPADYRALAQMQRGAVLQAQGDLDGAIAAFDAAAEAARNPVARASAQIRAAYIVADTQDFPALQARLTPIIEEGGAMSFLARELLGVEAWEAGQPDLARETLQNLTLAFEAPEAVRQRAQVALAVLPPAPAGAPAPEQPAEPSPGESK